MHSVAKPQAGKCDSGGDDGKAASRSKWAQTWQHPGHSLSSGFWESNIFTWVNGNKPLRPFTSPSHWPLMFIRVTFTISPTCRNITNINYSHTVPFSRIYYSRITKGWDWLNILTTSLFYISSNILTSINKPQIQPQFNDLYMDLAQMHHLYSGFEWSIQTLSPFCKNYCIINAM